MTEPVSGSDVIERAKALWESSLTNPARPAGGPRRVIRSSFTVRDLPPSERPRERLFALGSKALSAAELLACLLGRGVPGESVVMTAQKLLARFGSLRGIAEASAEELARVRGVGHAKSAQLKAACELARRIQEAPAPPGAPITTSEEAIAAAARHLAMRRREHFILLLLDSRHRVLKISEVSVGSLDASIVHPRETFREAITACAAAIILAHNHPSGDPAPSPEDLELTRRLVEGGTLLGIPVLDHIIVGAGRNVSLKASGYWPDGADA